MKSPYKISKEIGVSPQAVYKKLDSQFIKQYATHIQRGSNGKYLLDVDAEMALKGLFDQVEQPVQQSIEQSVVQLVDQQLYNQLKDENNFLRKRIEDLEHYLETERLHNREQSSKVIDLANQLTELTRNNQILLGVEQGKSNSKLLIKDNSNKKRKWSFWFFNKDS